MKGRRRGLLLAVLLVVVIPAGAWWTLYRMEMAPAPGQPLFPPFNLSDRLARLDVREEEGEVRVVFERGGEQTVYEAEAFLREVNERQAKNKGWRKLFSILDITSWTSIFWVSLGFIGQALFMGRMLVQWVATEKAKSSVVPPLFWWLSLTGSTMLIIYFVWRVEVVGILGQSTGWFIYIRNLWYIHGHDAGRE